MNMIHKVAVLSTLICGFFSSMNFIGVHYLAKKFTQRPVYSQERKLECERNREILLQQYNAQKYTFTTQDNIVLHGLLIHRPAAKNVILLCHGYRMCKERLLNIVTMFPDDSIFLFDYRAHCESDGMCTTLGYHEKKDVLAALSFLKECSYTTSLPIIGLGVSMGAVSLLAAAAETNAFKTIILDSAFLRLDHQARRFIAKKYKLPSYPFGFLSCYFLEKHTDFKLASVNCPEWAQKITIPVLIIHSIQDSVVDYRDAMTLYDHFKAPKEIWLAKGSGHARIFNDCLEDYKTRIQAFLAEIDAVLL